MDGMTSTVAIAVSIHVQFGRGVESVLSFRIKFMFVCKEYRLFPRQFRQVKLFEF